MRWVHALLSFAISIGSSGPASAQTDVSGSPESYVWRNVRVGGGGFSPGIVFSPSERGLAYLRTDIGGVYRWDARAGTWVPLQDHMPQSNYFGIESVAPDPRDPNVVYVAAGMYRRDPAAILRSADRGMTWDVYPTQFRMGGNEDGRGLGERLAIDPNDTSILYFASRHDGLQRSVDRGKTWAKVAAFPYQGRGLPRAGPTNAGLSFVVFDPSSSTSGARTRRIFVGVADAADTHLYDSSDAGETWRAVPNQPDSKLLPVQAQIDSRGVLYLAYATSVGPNGVTGGAVFRFDTRREEWREITPDRSEARPPGGYMGLSVDRLHPGTLVVATMNRWQPGDTIWRTRDDGAHWTSLAEKSDRYVEATPFLKWGESTAEFGHWIAGIAIDPFDSSHIAYTTGATVHATRDLLNIDRGKRIRWQPWVDGVEETAIITLTSPPLGPALLSGFGDVSGFVHERLDRSPPTMHLHPPFTNTVFLDYAGRAPNVVVRGGRARVPRGEGSDRAVTLAWSDDFGRHWKPLQFPPDPPDSDRTLQPEHNGTVAIVITADGANILAMSPRQRFTRDRGRTWQVVEGLRTGWRVVADREDPARLYALDFLRNAFNISSDGGATFAHAPSSGLPGDIRADEPTNIERPWPLLATPGRAGHLWFVSTQGLFRSTDSGSTFVHVESNVKVEALAFGKAPPKRDYPALFAIGFRGDLRAIWRSDDEGRTWLRVNDDRHEYGRRYRVIAGDPRVFGRVYVGTDGRGIVYGEPVIAR